MACRCREVAGMAACRNGGESGLRRGKFDVAGMLGVHLKVM
jgi:hypothetical protein